MSQEIGSLRALKFIVISMGIVLIFGTAMLFAILIKKGKEDIQLCSRDIDITLTGTIQSFQKEDYSVSLLTRSKDGTQKLAIIDLCRGKTQTITITPPAS